MINTNLKAEIERFRTLNYRFVDLRSAGEVENGTISAQNWSKFNICPLKYEGEISNLGEVFKPSVPTSRLYLDFCLVNLKKREPRG